MANDARNDPMIRDGKKLPLSGFEVVPQFILSLFMLPLFIFVLLPLTLVCILITKVFSIGKKPIHDTEDKKESNKEFLKPNKLTEPKELDLVVFGATGFTGKMAAKYLAKNYGTTLKWGISGRRKDALEKVKADLCVINDGLSTLPIIIADTSSPESIDSLTRKTKVVITTAGPFDKYGSILVKFCALNGTHYCDITGETDWVRKMIDQYDDLARESGARIVNFCGHDCVPWDLAVLECAKILKNNKEQITEISCYDELNSAPSGGTLATIFHSLSNRQKYQSQLGFDPLLKSLTGSKSSNKLISKIQNWLSYSKEHRCWVGPFVMAMVMANCVRRSNCINNYNTKLTYRESLVYPSFMAGVVTITSLLIFATTLFCPPLKWLMQSTVLPSPGQGPTEEFMDKGFLKLTAYALGSLGGRVKLMLYFPTDPGYRDTARILVESGLVLALDDKKIKVGGGLYTPASCQGELLTQRLLNSGSSMTVE